MVASIEHRSTEHLTNCTSLCAHIKVNQNQMNRSVCVSVEWVRLTIIDSNEPKLKKNPFNWHVQKITCFFLLSFFQSTVRCSFTRTWFRIHLYFLWDSFCFLFLYLIRRHIHFNTPWSCMSWWGFGFSLMYMSRWLCVMGLFWDLPVRCTIVSVLVYKMNPTSTET